MDITIHDGLLFEVDPVTGSERMIDAPEADDIARTNGFQFAERLVKWYAGRKLSLVERRIVSVSD